MKSGTYQLASGLQKQTRGLKYKHQSNVGRIPIRHCMYTEVCRVCVHVTSVIFYFSNNIVHIQLVESLVTKLHRAAIVQFAQSIQL